MEVSKIYHLVVYPKTMNLQVARTIVPESDRAKLRYCKEDRMDDIRGCRFQRVTILEGITNPQVASVVLTEYHPEDGEY
jgi:hypothetical protein